MPVVGKTPAPGNDPQKPHALYAVRDNHFNEVHRYILTHCFTISLAVFRLQGPKVGVHSCLFIRQSRCTTPTRTFNEQQPTSSRVAPSRENVE